ncbi:NACHT domain-containing protein [Streptomyces sp. NPDC002785]|uniref:NACHT domain-containing protein n=1 Tax=Streptomyces sp. NPDC002785 TaxID=3154543 RepID=UPI003328686A
MLTTGRRRERRKWQAVAAACVLLILASLTFTIWAIVTGKEHEPPDTATLLGVPIGVIGLMIAVVAMRKPVEDNGAQLARACAVGLARQVRDGESQVWLQLLGADTRRINLTYVLQSTTTRVAMAPPAGRTFTKGPATVPDVREYFQATEPRRLVITGAAGAGKTVLALELMIALIDHRSEDDPVPIRISLAQWDTDQPLSTLLMQRLTEAYELSSKEAAGLIAHGMVLPVLDGLDEMDPLANGTPNPEAPRARAALNELNRYQDGLKAGPVVLTCRTGHYDALALSPNSRLLDAARVAIAPIDTHRAIDYLRSRILDAPRWQPLIDQLDTQPASPLAAILSTPWRLCLTATVYHHEGDPSDLLHHADGHDLDQYLLSRYLRATITNSHAPHRYQPDDVHRWLNHLTSHLAGTPTRAPATDITLHHLWPLAGTTRVRITDFAVTVIPFAFVEIFFVKRAPGPLISFAFIAVLACFAVFRPTPQPNRLRVSWGRPGRRSARRFWAKFKIWLTVTFASLTLAMLAIDHVSSGSAHTPVTEVGLLSLLYGLMAGTVSGLMEGLAGGFATGFKTWFRAWFAIGLLVVGISGWLEFGSQLWSQSGENFGLGFGTCLMIGLFGGITGGFIRGVRGEPVTLARPREIIRGDMVYGLLIGPLAGLLVGLLLGLPGGLLLALISGPLYGLKSGLIFVFTTLCLLGIVVGIATGFARAARRYGVFLLCSRSKLPFRLGAFLDWAVTAGLLRYSGPGYQFRHRELQQWFADNPSPLPRY